MLWLLACWLFLAIYVVAVQALAKRPPWGHLAIWAFAFLFMGTVAILFY